MTGIDTAIAAVVIPTALLGANWTFRRVFELQDSASADVLITLLIFQVGVVIDAGHFKSFIAHPDIQQSMLGVFLLLIVLTLFAWVLVLAVAEKTLHLKWLATLCDAPNCFAKSTSQSGSKRAVSPSSARFMAFFLPVALVGGTLSAFVIGR